MTKYLDKSFTVGALPSQAYRDGWERTFERRAPIQREDSVPSGTIAWSEHIEAYVAYVKKYGNNQSAERLAERGGFGFFEITNLLGHEPKTWRPR